MHLLMEESTCPKPLPRVLWFGWSIECPDGRNVTVRVPTRADACRAVELWRKVEAADRRERAAWHRSNYHVTWRACGRWSAAHNRSLNAWSRFIDFCQSRGFEACYYGEDPADCEPHYHTFMRDLAATLNRRAAV